MGGTDYWCWPTTTIGIVTFTSHTGEDMYDVEPGSPRIPRTRSSTRQQGDRSCRQHNSWVLRMDENKHHSLRWLGAMTREELREQNEASLRKEFQDRVDLVMPSSCPMCLSDFSTPDHVPSTSDSPSPATTSITFCAPLGTVLVAIPCKTCSCCQHCTRLHPVEMGCFPATPDIPEVWYSNEFMLNTIALRTTATIPMCLWVETVVKMHKNNGFETKKSVFDNLERAVAMYQIIHNGLNADESLGLRPIVSGGFLSCPCCYRKCHALCGDACLGLRHFRKVAYRSKNISPLEQATPFVPAAVVMDALNLRGENGHGKWGPG